MSRCFRWHERVPDRPASDGPPVDIIHVIGQGTSVNSSVYLNLDDEQFNASQFTAPLVDLPVMVLHTSRLNSEQDDLLTGLTPIISAAEVKTVVVIQGAIDGQAANCFAAVLYRNVARSESIQTAMISARRALYTEYPEIWFAPMVLIRSRSIRPIRLMGKNLVKLS